MRATVNYYQKRRLLVGLEYPTKRDVLSKVLLDFSKYLSQPYDKIVITLYPHTKDGK